MTALSKPRFRSLVCTTAVAAALSTSGRAGFGFRQPRCAPHHDQGQRRGRGDGTGVGEPVVSMAKKLGDGIKGSQSDGIRLALAKLWVRPAGWPMRLEQARAAACSMRVGCQVVALRLLPAWARV